MKVRRTEATSEENILPARRVFIIAKKNKTEELCGKRGLWLTFTFPKVCLKVKRYFYG